MKISEIDGLFEKCWKGYEKKGMKTMFGKRVPNCVKKESINEENPYASQDIMHDDPPVGIDYDFGNLPKVDWSRYSKKDIQKFVDHLESLDFEDGFQLDGEYHGMYRSAADWVEKNVLSKRQDESVELEEDLRAWFGKGKKGGAGGGGWDRYNTKGERVGKCGDSKPGEGKPKCLSKSRAASLRASGGKKAIANAVKRKKAKDPNQNRRGKAKNVNSHPKK